MHALLLVLLVSCAPTGKRPSRDSYPDFASMRAAHADGRDYRIRYEVRGSSYAVFAIHGGNIEPGTSQAALAVAGDDWSYYLFEGLRPVQESGRLHVTSSRFDDPAAVAVASSAVLGVSLHGARDMVDLVCVGGSNEDRRASVARSLEEAGFPTEQPCRRLPGRGPRNIVNRPRDGGVQLEISVPLCRKLERDETVRRAFAAAVRRGLTAP